MNCIIHNDTPAVGVAGNAVVGFVARACKIPSKLMA